MDVVTNRADTGDDERQPSVALGTVGADDAVAGLFRTESAALVSMLWAVTGDRRQAEDLAQEAFVRLYAKWHQLDDPSKAAGWLRVTALNLARSGFRHLAVVRRAPVPVDRDTGPLDDDAVLTDDRRHLVRALRTLPTRQRECVVLRYFGDMSESAIADALGVSANSVKTHLRRGLAALERRLEDRR